MNDIGKHINETKYYDSAINSIIENSAYIGHFDFSDPSGPIFEWPGSSIKARFKGTGISMNMKLFNLVERVNWFNV